MSILPIERMWDRVKIDKDKSDKDYFDALMYTGELMTKLVAAGMVAAVNDGRERHQYRLKYQLIRADGIGVWASAIDEIVNGVPKQHLLSAANQEAKELTQRTSSGTWQYDSVMLLDNCLKVAVPHSESQPRKIQAKFWFTTFAMLRNKTRGHGALPSSKLNQICPDLHSSIQLFVENFSLFKRGWAYLDETLKGKYRVIRWNDIDTLDFLKTRQGTEYKFGEGVHLHFGTETESETIRSVDLVFSDVDVTDIFLPNGGMKKTNFEALSYRTGETKQVSNKDYLNPITELPPSETQGLTDVIQRGDSITNLPAPQDEYIRRTPPEEKLYDEIVSDNQHRIITLIGRGGIGKTWLALEVLNKIAKEGHFEAIIWFSARDIDLLPDGAKQVKPHVLNEKEISKEFFDLIAPFMYSFEEIENASSQDALKFMQQSMLHGEIGPILFVFDNFETVRNPIELFKWIDTYLRLPNKALITTRFREFKGDYPIELGGMSSDECRQLIQITASRLGILSILNEQYKEDLIDDTNGHPYVVKIILGEVKKVGNLTKVETIIGYQDDMLDTLFERTYSRLSRVAQRVFLTLCNWKSIIPQLAIEAVLVRPENEPMNVGQAISDLHDSSLIERLTSPSDDEVFLSVPLVANKFGQRKLSVDRMQIAIEADTELLRYFGATQQTDVKHGLMPRLDRLIRNIEKRIDRGQSTLGDYLPILRFICKKYTPAWLKVASLCERKRNFELAEEMYKSYIEFSDDRAGKRGAWLKLVHFYSFYDRHEDEIFARLQLARLQGNEFDDISETANRFNNLLRSENFQIDKEQKQFIVNTLIQLMNDRLSEANADDCSNLAWLYIHANNTARARQIAERGLELDPYNHYCKNLLKSV